MSLSRLTHRARKVEKPNEKTGETTELVEWTTERARGWVVPIPVGYSALSSLHAAGTVANSRDATTPFVFVESVYSMGQWISPHRLATAHDMLWQTEHDPTQGLYRCINDFQPTTPSASNLITPAADAAQTL